MSGSNEAGATSNADDNYIFDTSTNKDCQYEILKSNITVALDSSKISKTYDTNSSATVEESALIKTSTNGGATACAINIVSATYDTATVGQNKTVTCTLSLNSSSTANYTLSTTEVSATVGEITRAEIVVVLNTKGGKAYKTYDASTAFASKTGNGKSTRSRTGQGMEIKGVKGTDDVTVTIVFAEAGNNRSEFDPFINNVVKDGSVYSVSATPYYKKLVVSVSGAQASNYCYTVYTYAENDDSLLRKEVGKSLTGDPITSFDIFDNRDTVNCKDGIQDKDVTFTISINKRNITATYVSETIMQSYVTSNNKFNTEWLRVAGDSNGVNGIVDSEVKILVKNGWMFADENDTGEEHDADVDASGQYVRERAEYTSYTTIKGAANSERLGAKIVDTNSTGKDINYVLRNQPTLTIGYFVEKDGSAYEISTMAGLILATYYYRMSFESTQYDGEEGAATDVSTIVTWKKLITGDTYEATGEGYKTFTPPEGVKSYTLSDVSSWDDYFSKYALAYNADATNLSHDIIIEFRLEADEANGGEWGYWAKEPGERIYYTDFIQVGDISGVLTADDIAILNGQIRGLGSTWAALFPNFLETTKGNISTAIGSIFRNENGLPFIGTYDGDGYIIENINVMGYATQAAGGTYNIGMFASVGNGSITQNGVTTDYVGSVSNVNLRNWNIVFSDGNSVATTINLGGIIGLSQQESELANSSFHGIITVNSANPSATINVGGLIGQYDGTGVELASGSNIVNGAIVLGNIYITHNGSDKVNAGGVVGYHNAANYKVNNVVSMAGIFATTKGTSNAKLGGLIGRASGSPLTTTGSKENAYLKDSIIIMNVENPNNITSTVVSKQIGTGSNVDGIEYSVFIDGSKSGYPTGTGKYLGKGIIDAGGKYDMLDDYIISASATHESPRLIDLIKIYVLLYSKRTTVDGTGENAKTVYITPADSWLVGNKLGTENDPFVINNQQQVAYLREFRFATFRLARDIDMYTAYSQLPFAGAFYGTVNAGSYKINLRASENAKMFQVELAGHALPLRTNTQE